MDYFVSMILIVVLALVIYRALRHGVDYHAKENMGLIAGAYMLTWIDPGSDSGFLHMINRNFYAFVLVYIVVFAAFTGRKHKSDS